ncbi:hypothetical protein IW261DRAFT_1473872 [Armillaria novae-zelandiae]|uniref:Uncharacterized protein n=1 Tax=Armillaria novae-zelandiae TaxID=153914 RepID=A0AA39PAJ9_9AGAR|nr:hypothetical protein IW261DRAFT_1473872 [Armillaria novae-zelandiae]
MTPPKHFPVLSSLPPPLDLFTSTAPYILTLTLPVDPQLVIVNCSHEPTLKLLNGYLQKWGKAHSMKLFPIKSKVCPEMVDTLIVKPKSSFWHRDAKVNPAIILAFIEGVVGYEMVYTTGSFWMYHRTTVFE